MLSLPPRRVGSSSGRTGRAGPRMQIVKRSHSLPESQALFWVCLCVFPRSVNPLGEEVGEST